MGLFEEVVFDDVADGGIDCVGDELECAVEGADVSFVGLVSAGCSAGGVAVYG